MLPAMWMSEACMNIAVKTVCQVGIVFGGVPCTWGCPWQATAPL